MSKSEIAIDVQDTRNTMSGMRHHLLLDPEDRTVSVWYCVGSGTPMSVWHNRARMIGVPETSAEVLQDWCEDHAEEIAGLLDRYKGSEWDGSNWVGTWRHGSNCERTGGCTLEAIEQRLEDSLAELPSYLDASDWLLGGGSRATKDEVRRAIVRGETMESLAKTVVAGALGEALLDLDDVIGVLLRIREEIDRDEADAREAELSEQPA